MGEYFITFRSVTLAQRGEGLLKRKGIHCQLQRTPRWMEQQGCGYCLRMRRSEIETCVRLLREGKVEFRKVYRQTGEGGGEEVVL